MTCKRFSYKMPFIELVWWIVWRMKEKSGKHDGLAEIKNSKSFSILPHYLDRGFSEVSSTWIFNNCSKLTNVVPLTLSNSSVFRLCPGHHHNDMRFFVDANKDCHIMHLSQTVCLVSTTSDTLRVKGEDRGGTGVTLRVLMMCKENRTTWAKSAHPVSPSVVRMIWSGSLEHVRPSCSLTLSLLWQNTKTVNLFVNMCQLRCIGDEVIAIAKKNAIVWSHTSIFLLYFQQLSLVVKSIKEHHCCDTTLCRLYIVASILTDVEATIGTLDSDSCWKHRLLVGWEGRRRRTRKGYI